MLRCPAGCCPNTSSPQTCEEASALPNRDPASPRDVCSFPSTWSGAVSCRVEQTLLPAFILPGCAAYTGMLHLAGVSREQLRPGCCFLALSAPLDVVCERITMPDHFSHACQLTIVPNLAFGHRPFCSACLVFISESVRDPGLKLLEVQMTSGFSAPPEYWLQCLSVHYSSKLMMQSTTCCLQLSVRVERSWQKCLVFCEQHVINSLGACSLYVDDYSLWYVFVYFWVLSITSCAIFLSLFWVPALIEQKGQPFVR